MTPYNELCKNIGLSVKYYRQRLNLTQLMLSEILNMDIHYISDIERGKKNITLRTLCKLASALQVEPKDFFIFPSKPQVKELSE